MDREADRRVAMDRIVADHPVRVLRGPLSVVERQQHLFAAMAFNPGQRRGPDGRWVKVGGRGGTSGEPGAAADKPPTPREALDSWVEGARIRYPDVKLDVSLNNAGIGILSRIEVPKAARGRGVGDAILSELTEIADRLGIALALTPSGDYGGSVPKLKAWYKKHGFLLNKGRNRDYGTTEDLIRPAASRDMALDQQRAAFTLAAQRARFGAMRTLATEDPVRYTTGTRLSERDTAMSTLNIVDVASGDVLDRVTLGPSGDLGYETGAARDIFESLANSLGITPAEAFEMRTDWSNGYIAAKLA
jgi:GNAT superfamily N-acetyltransferase